jgi:hypothetical protein
MADNRFTAGLMINGFAFVGNSFYGYIGAAAGAAGAIAYLDLVKKWEIISTDGWAWKAGKMAEDFRMQDAITAAFIAAPWAAKYFNLWPVTQYSLALAVPFSYMFANSGGVVYDVLRQTGLLTA